MSYALEVFDKRLELGLSIGELSKKTGIDAFKLRNIENGHIPELRDRLALSKFLGLDKEIVEGDENGEC